MNVPTDGLLNAAASILPDVIALRRDLHANPELGLQLPGTQSRIVEALTGLGLDIKLGESLTSVVADLDTGRPGPTVLLRGDMDALPLTEDSGEPFSSTVEGRMHACGHDTHVAMLVGAARVLAANKDELNGRVRFMFQPGEEGFHGARYMIEEGVLEGVDRAFAIHVDTNLPAGMIESRPGALLASSDELHITLTGRGGHASAPHQAIDPIPAACAMVTAFQTMVTREIDTFDPTVVTVARISSGTTNNIIPETAHIEGTIRAFSEATRAQVHDSIARVAEGVAAAHNCSCDVAIKSGYPVTVNHAPDVELVKVVTEATLGEGRYREAPSPNTASEDFSYVLQNVPGAMATLGVCPEGIEDPNAAASLHSNRAVMNEGALPSGIALHAAMAMARPK
jgi:hippurate hydrolase